VQNQGGANQIGAFSARRFFTVTERTIGGVYLGSARCRSRIGRSTETKKCSGSLASAGWRLRILSIGRCAPREGNPGRNRYSGKEALFKISQRKSPVEY